MNILDFGAKRGAFCGDAIQRAIDAAAAQGGGRVSVPAGEYETASLVLRSNVELHLEAGAVLEDSGYEVAGLPGANHDLGKLYIALDVAHRI